MAKTIRAKTIKEARDQERAAWGKVLDQLVVAPYNLPPNPDEYLKGFYYLLGEVRDAMPVWAKRELLRRQAVVDPAFRDQP